MKTISGSKALLAPRLLAVFSAFCLFAQFSSAQLVNPSLADALDDGQTWTTSSYNQWAGQTQISHDGSDAATTVITNSYYYDDAWIQTTVTGPARIGFWWLYDSLGSSGYLLELQVDNSTALIAKTVSVWASNYVDVPFGTHTLKWHAHNSPYYAGQLLVALDEVTVTPLIGDPPQVTVTPNAASVDVGQPLTIHATATGTGPLNYYWSFHPPQTVYVAPPSLGSADYVLNHVTRANAGTYTVMVQSLYGSAQASAVVTASLDGLAESLDTTNLQWSLSGAVDWVGETNVTHDGVDAVQSPAGSYYQSYSLLTQIDGPASVKYFVKYAPNLLSYGYGSLTVNIDDFTAKEYVSDGFDWEQDEVLVPFGSHVVKWALNSGYYSGSVAWLDQVTVDPLSGDAPAITSQSSDATVNQGDGVDLTVEATGSPDLSYQWYWIDPVYGESLFLFGETNSTFHITANISDGGAYIITVSNLFGIATNSPINLTVTPSRISLRTALDDPNLVWYAPDGAWFGQSHVTHDHHSAAEGGPESMLQTTVVGPGTLTFWWKSAGEIDFYDASNPYSAIASYLGTNDWQLATIAFTAGPHVIQWISVDSAAYVDSVRFTAEKIPPPTIVEQPKNQVVDMDGTATFVVKANAAPPFTYQWSLNGSDIYGANDSVLYIPDATPDTFGYYSVRVINAFGTAYSKPALLSQKTDFGTAVGEPGTGWWSYDSETWFTQNQVKHGRSPAIQSMPMPDNGAEAMLNNVVGPGNVSFWWRVSSETNFDLLQFSIGDELVATISGNTGWRYCTFRVPAGQQMLQWMYSKDDSVESGMDCGWISDVVFTPDPPPITQIVPHEQTVYEGSVAHFSASVPAAFASSVSYLWTDSDQNELSENSDIKFVPAMAPNAGTYSLTVLGDWGACSDSAILHVKPAVAGVRALAGTDIRLKLNTSGETPTTFTWWDAYGDQLFDDGRITGSTNPVLQIRATTIYDSGDYSVAAVDDYTGYTWQPVATVTVIPTGPIIGWGINDVSGTDGISCPADLHEAVAISTGLNYTMALLPDGTVRMWNNTDGTDVAVPDGLSNVTMIGVGNTYAAALTKDGTVVTWNLQDVTTVQELFTNVRSISVGPDDNVLAVNRDGTVSSEYTDSAAGDRVIPAEAKGIVAVAASVSFDSALTRSGKIICWGNNDYGQLMPPHVTDAIAIAAGDRHGLALRRNGTVVAWGDNSNGQTSVPSGLNNVVAIAAGAMHSVALTRDGRVVTWGGTYEGAGLDSSSVPIGLRNVARISAASIHTVALIYAPTIMTQPQVQFTDDPNLLYITVDAGGRAPMFYDWRLNGHFIKTTKEPYLTVHNPSSPEAAARLNYDVVVRNRYGSVVSQRINVGSAVFFDLLNGSVITQTYPGGDGVVSVDMNNTNIATFPPPVPLAALVVDQLNIARQGDSIILNWPAASGLRLEAADSVSGPFSSDTLSAPVSSGGTNSLTIPVSEQQKFYRLRMTAN